MTLPMKLNITILSSHGDIDTDYRDCYCKVLMNLSSENIVIRNGDEYVRGLLAGMKRQNG
jgi:dUTPase